MQVSKLGCDVALLSSLFLVAAVHLFWRFDVLRIFEVIIRAKEYFIPYTNVSISDKISVDLTQSVLIRKRWSNLRTRFELMLENTKHRKPIIGRKAFNTVILASCPSRGKEFRSIAKLFEMNFCRSSLPPLLIRSDWSLAHTAEEKANLSVFLFTCYSHLEILFRVRRYFVPG